MTNDKIKVLVILSKDERRQGPASSEIIEGTKVGDSSKSAIRFMFAETFNKGERDVLRIEVRRNPWP